MQNHKLRSWVFEVTFGHVMWSNPGFCASFCCLLFCTLLRLRHLHLCMCCVVNKHLVKKWLFVTEIDVLVTNVVTRYKNILELKQLTRYVLVYSDVVSRWHRCDLVHDYLAIKPLTLKQIDDHFKGKQTNSPGNMIWNP